MKDTREREYVRENMRGCGLWVVLIAALLIAATLAILLALTFTGVIKVNEPEWSGVIIEGACKDLSIDKSEVVDLYLVDENLYIMVTKTNAYLVGCKIENGQIVYVDVEQQLIRD